ncbi:Transposon Tn7 transposition protein TnsA [Marinomonas aquimarina]|uniref:Transposon Tn7 transposition protein TnsA n=1 Tax=Marinomonas aquimarina TaxID=295068 RepID=A0A1A8T7X6_9GAMM|nr:TnsA endonuclease N-terminal domain-containing protein [Marinomonas aquimarina]SBS28411.1 Transposon Tn7 transposition protein TnsA [Marinomonas aquimarina]
MGKKLKGVTIERQQKWYEEHIQSLKPEYMYTPFWRADDIRSSGVKVKIPHKFTHGRLVHLLSLNELWMYLHLARNPLVVDVYEQFAIPLNFSLGVADDFGIEHPTHDKVSTPAVQTIDFVAELISPETGEIETHVIAVKHEEENDLTFRTEEKLALQKAYAKDQGYIYHLVTGNKLRTVFSVTLEMLYRHRTLPNYLATLSKSWLNNFAGAILDAPHERTAYLIDQASKSTGCNYQLGVQLFYNAMWHKKLVWDFNQYLKLEVAASDLGVHLND